MTPNQVLHYAHSYIYIIRLIHTASASCKRRRMGIFMYKAGEEKFAHFAKVKFTCSRRAGFCWKVKCDDSSQNSPRRWRCTNLLRAPRISSSSCDSPKKWKFTSSAGLPTEEKTGRVAEESFPNAVARTCSVYVCEHAHVPGARGRGKKEVTLNFLVLSQPPPPPPLLRIVCAQRVCGYTRDVFVG